MAKSKVEVPRLTQDELSQSLPQNYVYHSAAMIGIARRSYYEPDDREPPKNGITTIIMSVIALEGFMNELIHDAKTYIIASESRGRPVHENLKRYVTIMTIMDEKISIESKFLVASEILGGKIYEKGKPLYQNFHLLISLRNALVHTKPDGFTYTDEGEFKSNNDKLLKFLYGRKLIDRRDIPLGFTVGNKDIAKWAFNTAANMVRSIIEMCTRSDLRMMWEDDYLDEWQPIK